MKDRVPANPGRVLITPETGAAAFYATMTRADNPTQEGDPLNKNTLLKDATAALFGLGADAVPDDAFAFLGRLNQYCWKRRSKTVVYEASIETAKNVALTTGYNASRKIEYSSSYSVGEDGTATLNNPSVTADIGYRKDVSNATPLKGKYFCDCYYESNYSLTKGLFYVAPDAANASTAQNFNGTSDLYAVTMYVSRVTLTPNVSLGEWEYIFSNDRNAYPDSGIVDGTEYVFLGKPLENAISAGKIVTAGSYIGNGLSGSTNKVIITFDDIPKIVILYSVDISTNGSIAFLAESSPIGVVHYLQSSLYTSNLTVSWTDKTVSFYGSDASRMLNVSGATYKWIAFC